MVVATVLGGMGNQLHLYAVAYTVAKYLKQSLVLDVSDYYGGYFRPYVLDMLSIPNHLKIYYPHKKAIYSSPYDAPANFIGGFECLIDTSSMKTREELLSAVKGKKNVWITGYGGISFCTEEEKNELKKFFQPQIKSRSLIDFIRKVAQEESVAVHVRRTDYVSLQWTTDNEMLKYCRAAISYMVERIDEPEFYFFSDDLEWVKEHLGNNDNYHYIDLLGGRETDVEELFCISACKHRILMNGSSFGAWASMLALQEGGINVSNRRVPGIPRIFIMNKEMIADYESNYKADYVKIEESVPWDLLEAKLSENNNNEVIDYINKISIDAYGILPEMKERLMELKGIAHLQENDIKMALSVFDELQQKQRDSFDFSFNYSVALKWGGHYIESLLYMGNALKINRNIVLDELIKTENKWERSLLDLVSEQKKKHYIFLDSSFQRNIKSYYDSIAVMLRNLGNKVSILDFQGFQTFAQNVKQIDKNLIMQIMLNSKEKQDSVYDWGIVKYRVWGLVTENGEIIFDVSDFLSGLAEEKNIVFIAHSKEGVRNATKDYPLIFLDTVSEWDVEKTKTMSYSDVEWNFIYQTADKVVTKKPIQGEWGIKRVYPFESEHLIGTDEICFVNEKITDLSHYMRNDESLCGVLSVLKAVKELEISPKAR